LNCRDSLSNSFKFNEINTDPGSKIKIFCPESCTTTDAPVYGGGEDTNYTKDSAICRAAFHTGKLSSKGGSLLMNIKGVSENFKGELRNGIKSQGKLWSVRTISFEPLEKVDPIVLKAGTKIDINTSGSEFKKGQIKQVNIINSSTTSLLINIQGGIPITLTYPNPKVKPCGTHFKTVDCSGSLKNYSSSSPITIRFITKDYATTGEFLPDYGEVYGKSGKPFGFSRNMSKRVISRGTSNKPELETFVEFPPSPLSRYCNKPNPDTNCEPVVWSAWTGPGKFKVKLLIGDILNDINIDFVINGKVVAKSLKIQKNKLHIIEEVIESKGGFITLGSECKENCEYALSKLNAIQISPFEVDEMKKNKKVSEKKLNCGEAYEKGRCDIGPDVTHCLFEDQSKSSAKFCSGINSLVKIPNDYKCKEQIGKYKCVKVEYDSEEECKKFCPKLCNTTKCLF
jgi:hypothetical protein